LQQFEIEGKIGDEVRREFAQVESDIEVNDV